MNYIYFIVKITISLPILLIHIFLNFFINLKIGKLDTSRIGNILAADLYIAKKKLEKKNSMDIWVTDKKFCNFTMLDILKRNFTIFNYLKFYYEVIHYFSLKSNLLPDLITQISLNKDYKYVHSLKTQLNLSARDIKEAKKQIKNIRIPKNNGIICFTCRDEAYLKTYLKNKNYKYHSYRNSEINSFKPLIKKLIKKKYFVVRMGKTADKRVGIKDKYFLDYPFSSIKSDLLDFYFTKICNLWVGSNTGLDCLAVMFQKPMVIINLSPAGVILHNIKNKKAIYHLKTYYLNNKRISLQEIFDKNLHNIGKTEIFEKKKVKLKSATAKEIIEICIEGINFFLNKKKFLTKDIINQNKYKNLLSILLKRKKSNFISFLSPIFLRKNKWLIKQ